MQEVSKCCGAKIVSANPLSIRRGIPSVGYEVDICTSCGSTLSEVRKLCMRYKLNCCEAKRNEMLYRRNINKGSIRNNKMKRFAR